MPYASWGGGRATLPLEEKESQSRLVENERKEKQDQESSHRPTLPRLPTPALRHFRVVQRAGAPCIAKAVARDPRSNITFNNPVQTRARYAKPTLGISRFSRCSRFVAPLRSDAIHPAVHAAVGADEASDSFNLI